jgi:hypothetical protein
MGGMNEEKKKQTYSDLILMLGYSLGSNSKQPSNNKITAEINMGHMTIL